MQANRLCCAAQVKAQVAGDSGKEGLMFRAMLKDGSWVGLLGLAVLAIGSLALGADLFRASVAAGLAAIGFGGLIVAVALRALRARKARYGDGPTSDEREEVIRMRGDNAGALALMVYWSLACLVPLVLAKARREQTIAIDRDWLGLALGLSCGLFALVRTLVIRRIRRKELADGQR